MSDDLLAGYLSEQEVAAQRRKSLRTLRNERARGEGPPYVRDRRTILYPIAGFRAWLASREHNPVREPRPIVSSPQRGARRRALDSASA
jgi:hypothetical protein